MEVWSTLESDNTTATSPEEGGLQVAEFRKGSWDNKLNEALGFVNQELADPVKQLVDIGLTMSNTDYLACIHVYYRATQFGEPPAKDGSGGLKKNVLHVTFERWPDEWATCAGTTALNAENFARNGTLFRIAHGCHQGKTDIQPGNNSSKHIGAATFIFFWEAPVRPQLDVPSMPAGYPSPVPAAGGGSTSHKMSRAPGRLIQVAEFRKSSWDTNLAQAVHFINTSLEDPEAQLVDIGLSMSGEDRLACIHVYYTQAAAESTGSGNGSSKSQLALTWKRWKTTWATAAKGTAPLVERHAKGDTLFSVAHVCGNHAYAPGGAVTIVFHWQRSAHLTREVSTSGAVTGVVVQGDVSTYPVVPPYPYDDWATVEKNDA